MVMRGRLGRALHGKADGERGQVEGNPAQVSSPIQCVLHFNSDSSQLQQEDDSNQTSCAGTQAVNYLLLPAAAKEIERFWNYSFRMLPNGRILSSNECSDAAVWAAVLEVGL
jgi:hypothetical protein